jgi:protein-tyrosine phosphatase
VRRYYANFIFIVGLLASSPAWAGEPLRLRRLAGEQVILEREDTATVNVWLSTDTSFDDGDRLVVQRTASTSIELTIPSDRPSYVILVSTDGLQQIVAERRLPLEQASNFRDIGGYITRDGYMVRWGVAYRSGAMPLLTEADYSFIAQLGIGAVVDLRSLEERELAPDQLDDRTGALFLSNDYSIVPMMMDFASRGGENTYANLELLLAPQMRALFDRLLAQEGAVIYHCSAGQDRTGLVTAVLYDLLGVDRDTILADYHLSTTLRRPEFEIPDVDPTLHQGNPVLRYHMAAGERAEKAAEPLYSPSGQSHLAQFFTYLDARYGGSEGYVHNHLGMTIEQIKHLRSVMLQSPTDAS